MANTIELLNIVVDALKIIERDDKEILNWSNNKIPFCHRLAFYIENQYKDGKCILFPPVKRKVFADILLKSKSNRNLMAIFYSRKYFTKEEFKALFKLSVSKPNLLILGLVVQTKKNYVLIYRITAQKIEYFHFSTQNEILSTLKRKEVKEINPSLNLQFSQKRKK